MKSSNARRVRDGLAVLVVAIATAGPALAQVRTDAGMVEGAMSADGSVRAFKGIPYAAPPLGALRWQPPQPPAKWTGTRKAVAFGSRCLQAPIYSDMIFRDEQSEDCLYLNVWAPAKSKGPLPVMVWIYGGGFQTGSTSEPRQDGERLAGKGVVVVSMNYRVGIFGFFPHPELTKESPHGASGNYGLLDQIAALQWVQRNVAAFGGEAKNVTIFGESAGSFSVSALMASPLSQGLFHRAIGESGAFFSPQPLPLKSLEASEEAGAKFAPSVGADSLAALRAKPGADLITGASRERWFTPSLDGWVLPRDAYTVFAAGQQSHVPLLAGWNADETRAGVLLGGERPTARSFTEQTQKRFGADADALLKVYPATSDAEAVESAASLGSDLFIGYGTWKWVEMHAKTGGAPVFCYSFDRKIPVPPDHKVNGKPATSADVGARHAGEIEYVFGALDSVPKVTWEPVDRKLSDLIMSYWSNFARSGDPNGPGLPKWPRYDESGRAVMHLDGAASQAAADTRRPRYEALDAITEKTRGK